MISYYIGFYGGRFFLGKYGKYFLLNKKHLDWAEKWFNRKSGWLTIFIARFIPVIRHIISIPAGIGKMKMKSFLPATILGAAIWNSFLTFVGFLLNKEWDSIGKYSSQIDYIILIFICLFVIWFIYREGKKHK